MIACRRCSLLVFAVFVVACSVAQNTADRSERSSSSEPAKVPLRLVSTVPVPSLPAEVLTLPLLCGRGNAIVARFASITTTSSTGGGRPLLQATRGDPVAISPEGKIVARFGREKISDVQQPLPLDTFLADNNVYMLTQGEIPQGYQTKWRTPRGEVVQQQAVKRQYFIARFKQDGTYVNAVSLDIPFWPLQLGVFNNGDFLIAGEDGATGNPRIAIVGSDGQFLRLVELKGDVHARTESDVPGRAHDKTALPRYAPGQFGESLTEVLSASQIVGSGSELLLFRPAGSSLFSISSGADVQTRKLNVPGELRIFAVKPSENSWVVEFTRHDSGAKAEEFDTYAFDPATGDPLTQYIFPNDLGFGLACADGAEFTFLMAETEGNGLKLVKLAPGTPNK